MKRIPNVAYENLDAENVIRDQKCPKNWAFFPCATLFTVSPTNKPSPSHLCCNLFTTLLFPLYCTHSNKDDNKDDNDDDDDDKMGWEGIKQRFRGGGSTKSRRQKETIEFLLKELEDLQEEKANLEDECAQLRVSNWNTNQEYRVLRDKLRSAQTAATTTTTDVDDDNDNNADNNDNDNDLLLLFGGNAQKRLEEIQTRRLERNVERFQRSFKDLDQSNSSEIQDELVKYDPTAAAAESSSQVGESAAAAKPTTSSSSSQQTRSGEELSELDAVRRELSQTQRIKERLARELAHAKSDFQDVTETLQTCLKNMDKLSKLTQEKEAERKKTQQQQLSSSSNVQQQSHRKTVEALCADLQQQEQDIGYLEHVIRDNLRMKLESIYEKNHHFGENDDDDEPPLRGVLTKQESAEMAREQHTKDMLRLRLRHQSQLVKLNAELENKDREIAALQDDLTKSLNSMMSLSTELDKVRSQKGMYHHGVTSRPTTNHHKAADTTTNHSSSVHDSSSGSSNMHSHDDNASDDAFIESMDRSRVEFMQELRVSMKSLDGQSLDSSNGVVEPPPPIHRSYRGNRRSRHDDHDSDDDDDDDDDDDNVDFDEYDDDEYDDEYDHDDNSDLYDASDFAGAVKSHASVDSNEPVVGESVDAKDRTIAYLYAENGRLKHSFAMERTLLEEAIRVQAQQLSNLTGMQRATNGRPRPGGGGGRPGGRHHVSFPNVPRPIYEYEPTDRRRFDSDSS